MRDSTSLSKSLRQNKLLSQGFFVNQQAALIVILSTGLSLASFLYFYLYHQTLAYHDARAHLQIARQVVAGLPKGFSQLGGIWLPLQHLLMLPTVWIDFFYYSGLSGSLISMLAYILASVFLLKIGKLIFQDSVAAFIATLVFMLNPNLLYLQSAPMTESLLIFTFLASLYYFLKWNRYFRHRDLIFAASWAFLATLTRYDGWFLVICEAIALVIIAKKSRFSYHKTQGLLLSYLTLAGFGIFLWLVWGTAIFSNPLYFAFGKHSAYSQQASILAQGLLHTKHNPFLSVREYVKVTFVNCGALVYGLFVLGLCVHFAYKRFRVNTLSGYLLLFPFVFHIIALFVGHSRITFPGFIGSLYHRSLINIRYGLMMLPAVAIFIGGLALNKRRWLKVLLVALIILQPLLMIATGDIVTLEDATFRREKDKSLSAATDWLAKNYNGGMLLTDIYANAALLIYTKVKTDEVIHQGSRDYWKESLEHPSRYARWIWMTEGDRLWVKIHRLKEFKEQFAQVFKRGTTAIYQRKQNRKR